MVVVVNRFQFPIPLPAGSWKPILVLSGRIVRSPAVNREIDEDGDNGLEGVGCASGRRFCTDLSSPSEFKQRR